MALYIPTKNMGWGNIVINLTDLVFQCKQHNLEPYVHESLHDVLREVKFHGFHITNDTSELPEYKPVIYINDDTIKKVHPLMRQIIEPSDRMKELIQKNRHLVDDVSCGMHIRRGAFSEDSSKIGCHGHNEDGTIIPAYFANDAALERFEQLVEKSPGKVFIASDSKEIKKRFKEKFGDKINFLETDIALTYDCTTLKNRDTTKEDDRANCYLEWFLLSMCRTVCITAGNADASNFSTFGYTAAIYGNCEIKIVTNYTEYIISYSLWGDNKVYTYGMVENVLLAREIYPDWVVKVHYNDTVPSNIIDWLKKQANVEMVHHEGTKKKASNTFWRFEDIFSDNTVIVRDSDSRLNIREKKAVDEWLNSTKDFHIMRDHEHHLVPIIAGAFGSRNNACKYLSFPNQTNNYNQCPFDFVEGKHVLENFIANYAPNDDVYMIDQKFLYSCVYPTILNNSFVHTSHNRYEPHSKDFPKTDYYDGFVCEVITKTPNASKIFGDESVDFERIGQY